MRINCHTHVFNFRSIFTEGTLDILLARLGREKWPDFVMEAVTKTLKKLIKGEYLDEEQLLRELVELISVSGKFKKYLKKLNQAIPADVSVLLHGDLDGLATGALRELIRKLGDLIQDNEDAANETLSDMVDFLVTGIQPSIDHVTRRLMNLSGPDTAAVGLTLDLSVGAAADEKLYRKQLEDTSRAALAFPGRLFPFVCVNTQRASHYELMEQALTQKGYTGVKLYPSLGYTVDSPEMRKVFAYAVANEVPLLMHCNRIGFARRVELRENCSPALWRPILKQFPKLKICFGHFGGEENLVGPGVAPGSWTETILALMEEFPGVYADISYHTDEMQGGEKEANYFANMKRLLKNNPSKQRILYGSDYYLVRKRLREDNHWRYFQAKFSSAEFRQIAEINPLAFLGLPAKSGAPVALNIGRYVDFLAGKRVEVGEMPPEWVLKLVKERHGDVIFHPNPWGVRWSINNAAHYYIWQFFRTMMKAEHVNLPFNQAGGLLTRQLPGWPSEQVTAEIRAGRLREHATAAHVFLVSPGVGAGPEPGVTRIKAERALLNLFSNGDTRLAEFGAVADSLYRFKQEIA